MSGQGIGRIGRRAELGCCGEEAQVIQNLPDDRRPLDHADDFHCRKSWATVSGKPRQFRLMCDDVRSCLSNRIFPFADQEYLICSGSDYEEAFDEEEGEIAYLFDI